MISEHLNEKLLQGITPQGELGCEGTVGVPLSKEGCRRYDGTVVYRVPEGWLRRLFRRL